MVVHSLGCFTHSWLTRVFGGIHSFVLILKFFLNVGLFSCKRLLHFKLDAFYQSHIHMHARTQSFPVEHCFVTRHLKLFTSPFSHYKIFCDCCAEKRTHTHT